MVKKHFYNENSIILIPNSSDLILYLENQNICNVLKYDINKTPKQIIDLVDKKVGLRRIREWLIDTKFNCSKLLVALKKSKVFSVLIDNQTNSRLLADKNIYPTLLFDKNDLDWKGYSGKIETRIFFKHNSLKNFNALIKRKKKRIQILISFGGQDPKGLTIFAMKSLAQLEKSIKIQVVIGPLFRHRNKIKNVNKTMANRFEVIENCNDLSRFISNANCLLTAIGTTLFESLHMKTPCIVVSNYRSDVKDENKLRKFRGITMIGHYKKITGNRDFLFKIVKRKLECKG